VQSQVISNKVFTKSNDNRFKLISYYKKT